MFEYENDSHYVKDERGELYLCPPGEFLTLQASRAALRTRCMSDEANIEWHAFEGR